LFTVFAGKEVLGCFGLFWGSPFFGEEGERRSNVKNYISLSWKKPFLPLLQLRRWTEGLAALKIM